MGQPDDRGLEPPTTELPEIPRDVRRSRRKREVRARTVSVSRMTKRELELGRLLYPSDENDDIERPRTRADCKDGQRPCPFVACVHHLYLDVSARTGAIKLNFPDLEPDELAESCSLDIADRQGSTLEEVGTIMNLTRERIRQVEVKGLAKLLAAKEMLTLRDFIEVGPVGKRKLPVLQANDDEDQEDDAGEESSSNGEADFDADHFASEALDAE